MLTEADIVSAQWRKIQQTYPANLFFSSNKGYWKTREARSSSLPSPGSNLD